MRIKNPQPHTTLWESVTNPTLSQAQRKEARHKGGQTVIPFISRQKKGKSKISNLRLADDTTLMAESKEELKSLLMKVKEESEKTDLKLSIQKTKIMASSPITSWQIDGETVETVTDFIFLAPKSLQMVTAVMKLEDACSLEGKL